MASLLARRMFGLFVLAALLAVIASVLAGLALTRIPVVRQVTYLTEQYRMPYLNGTLNGSFTLELGGVEWNCGTVMEGSSVHAISCVRLHG